MVRDDFPKAISHKIQNLLVTLADSSEGKAITIGMETARFTIAKDEDYDVVRAYIQNFEEKVRLVENN